MHSGKASIRMKASAFLHMEVGLFQTYKGAVIKILRSQVVPRHPDMVWYSLYGTKGFIENGRGGWGKTTGQMYVEGEMPKQPGAQAIECPTVDPSAPAEALSGGHGTSEYYLVRDFIAALEQKRPPAHRRRARDRLHRAWHLRS